jgi:hypothetical protein
MVYRLHGRSITVSKEADEAWNVKNICNLKPRCHRHISAILRYLRLASMHTFMDFKSLFIFKAHTTFFTCLAHISTLTFAIFSLSLEPHILATSLTRASVFEMFIRKLRYTSNEIRVAQLKRLLTIYALLRLAAGVINNNNADITICICKLDRRIQLLRGTSPEFRGLGELK